MNIVTLLANIYVVFGVFTPNFLTIRLLVIFPHESIVKNSSSLDFSKNLKSTHNEYGISIYNLALKLFVIYSVCKDDGI